MEETPEVAREGGEGKPSCTRKSLGEIRNKKWQLAEALAHRLISTTTTTKLTTCWAPAIHWDRLFSLSGLTQLVDKHSEIKDLCTLMFYLSDLKTSVYLSLIVAHGDEKVLFPFCGDTYGFPNKSWSGRMYFLLALQHPKQRNSPSLLHSSIRTKRVYCIPEEFTFS